MEYLCFALFLSLCGKRGSDRYRHCHLINGQISGLGTSVVLGLDLFSAERFPETPQNGGGCQQRDIVELDTL